MEINLRALIDKAARQDIVDSISARATKSTLGEPLLPLAETIRDDQILIVRETCRNWIAGFGFFKRLDRKLNKIAPEPLPPIPFEPLGRFGWEPRSSILVS